MAVEISLLNREYSQQALDLISDEFCSYSVLHSSQNILPSDYRNYLEVDWFDYAFGSECISLAAHDCDSGIVVGCLIAIPWSHDSADTESLQVKQQPIACLLRDLENMYLVTECCDISDVLLVDLAVVRNSSRRRGIYAKMRNELHRVAKTRGYSKVVGALSSAETQSFCIEKMQHKLIAQIPYASFTYKNRFPFESIKHPESIVLVEYSLD